MVDSFCAFFLEPCGFMYAAVPWSSWMKVEKYRRPVNQKAMNRFILWMNGT